MKLRHALFVTLCLSFVSCSGKGFDIGQGLGAATDAYKAATLSDEEVAKMAKGFATESDSLNPVAKPGNKYADRLARLTKGYTKEDGMTLDFKAYLVKDVNAFALANGSVRVFAGLMDKMSDNELLFVIGHEIGHVKHGHSKSAMRTAYAASAARKGAATQNNVAGSVAASELGGLLEKVINSQYSQAQEEESDDYGFAFLKKHKLDQKAAVSALKKLGELSDESSFLSSHPAPSDRAARLQEKLNG